MRSPAPPGEEPIWGGSHQTYTDPSAKAWLEAMASRGWTVPTWPEHCGGAGLDGEQVRILDEELRRITARAPLVRVAQGLTMLGPILLTHGTGEQQTRFLPPVARGETRWCQGFSEPDAGSDLANVRTRAEPHHDAYRVTGQKIWSSFAHQSDWIFCLVRMDPTAAKHQGIGFLLIDLRSPGVTVEPITLISGVSDFCEVFFDDVVVPAGNLVGRPDQGWAIAKELLAHERAMLGGAGGALSGGGPRRPSPIELARLATGSPEGPLPDEDLRGRLAVHQMELRALKALTRRMTDERSAGPAGPSLLKLVSTETFMRRQDLAVDVLGLTGMQWDGEGIGPIETQTPRDWLRSRANSIEGGTSEIQLNIIANTLLGPT
jgi:acyl-CoA dehydrogenase